MRTILAAQTAFALGLTLATTGCSSADDTTTGDTSNTGGDTSTDDSSSTTDDSSNTDDSGGERSAFCDFVSGYDGDELCLDPISGDEGLSMHVGPTDYDDPADVAQYLLEPGLETVECWYLKTANESDFWNRQRQTRMRPGSHHLILKTGEEREDGWGPCPSGLDGTIGGAQNSVSDSGYNDVAPEDEGFASLVEAHTQVAAELHYFNTGGEAVLREMWANYYAADPNVEWKEMNGIALIGARGLVIEPQSSKTIRYGAENTVDGRRIANVVGHVHAHTERFSAWIVRASGERELIYELYDWAEPFGMRFNTVARNPDPDAATGTEGGHSGLLYVDAGDRVEWECEVVNDLDITLTFANEALTAEMCILFGGTPEATWFNMPDAPL